MTHPTRRLFLQQAVSLGAVTAAGSLVPSLLAAGEQAGPKDRRGDDMAFGLVTYLWGRDWDLPTLIANCTKTGVRGVELRTTHAHGVEPNIGAGARKEVKKRFADSGVTLVGLGSNECYHHTNPKDLAKAIEATKGFVKLAHDVGASGVKVKPNDLPKGVDPKKTIEQIGKSLNVVGAFAADFGQQIRLEVHGSCARLPIMKQIMDVATHPNVALCWNSNVTDLKDDGLVHNFNLVKDRFGATAHVRQLDGHDYPWQQLVDLFVKIDYHGWLLLEAGGKDPPDRVKALAEQARIFRGLVKNAQQRLG